jgi:hypothetical protein
MESMKKLFLLFALIGSMLGMMGQGTTTAGINGQILDDNSDPLAGATVIAIHESTGSQYGAITGEQGYYRIQNMNVGGSYRMTISFVGYESYKKGNVKLGLFIETKSSNKEHEN